MPALKDNDLKVKYIIRNFDHYRGFLPRLNILLNWQFNMPTAINRLVIPAKAGIQYFIGFLDSGSPPGSSPGCGRNDMFNCRINKTVQFISLPSTMER